MGSTTCVFLASDSFILTNENKAEFIGQNNSLDAIKEAAENCPVNAIRVEIE
ncbi:ferredoxin [Bacillus hwajinpoensis]|jgi:ferredoxin|uniref:Ferredoxin n=2 Tax=Guptibacillus hwajinpoensis TaxID=208199 RepID=A0A845F0B0_9BACL|nr:ferredoxin [Pseudalkalibacillus hwajinpoensis]